MVEKEKSGWSVLERLLLSAAVLAQEDGKAPNWFIVSRALRNHELTKDRLADIDYFSPEKCQKVFESAVRSRGRNLSAQELFGKYRSKRLVELKHNIKSYDKSVTKLENELLRIDDEERRRKLDAQREEEQRLEKEHREKEKVERAKAHAIAEAAARQETARLEAERARHAATLPPLSPTPVPTATPLPLQQPQTEMPRSRGRPPSVRPPQTQTQTHSQAEPTASPSMLVDQVAPSFFQSMEPSPKPSAATAPGRPRTKREIPPGQGILHFEPMHVESQQSQSAPPMAHSYAPQLSPYGQPQYAPSATAMQQPPQQQQQQPMYHATLGMHASLPPSQQQPIPLHAHAQPMQMLPHMTQPQLPSHTHDSPDKTKARARPPVKPRAPNASHDDSDSTVPSRQQQQQQQRGKKRKLSEEAADAKEEGGEKQVAPSLPPQTPNAMRPAEATVQEKYLSLVESIKKNASSEYFQEPVMREQVPDYYDQVTNPMDLSTIQTFIKDGRIATVDELMGHFELIAENAKFYNPPSHPVAKDADKFLKVVARYSETLRIEEDARLAKQQLRASHAAAAAAAAAVGTEATVPGSAIAVPLGVAGAQPPTKRRRTASTNPKFRDFDNGSDD